MFINTVIRQYREITPGSFAPFTVRSGAMYVQYIIPVQQCLKATE